LSIACYCLLIIANDRTSHVDGKHQVDEIYHLASPASPPHYMYNPIKTIKTNSQGTLNMLGLARRVNARMLLASTSEVRIASFGPT
jgi:nucleoside-diphosphate-sugar epimerase